MGVVWDFSKLPEAEHEKVVELFDKAQWMDLMSIHNKYQLSSNIYCCPGHQQAIENWFTHAIENKLINGAKEAPKAK